MRPAATFASPVEDFYTRQGASHHLRLEVSLTLFQVGLIGARVEVCALPLRDLSTMGNHLGHVPS